MITASIVLYKNNRKILLESINSFLNSDYLQKHLYLVDNSPTNDLKDIILDKRVTYLFNPSNPGFGTAHNIAIKLAIEIGSSYHFIINPDIFFHKNVIPSMIEYMNHHLDVGMMMPQILNNDGSIQYLPKLLPTPLSVLIRKIKKPFFYYQKFINKYELRNIEVNKAYNAPVLSGCFTLLRLSVIEEVGFYDDKFFMYFEDWDLSRRIHEKYKTIYYPFVSVYHGYESGANKSIRLFKIFLFSMVYYFNKWGWLLDVNRKKINKRALEQFGL